jgi:hypothetical protein
MLELIIGVGETADAAEEGLKVITGMLVVGLIFLGVVVLGETSKYLRHRRKRARRTDEVNAWRPIRQQRP